MSECPRNILFLLTKNVFQISGKQVVNSTYNMIWERKLAKLNLYLPLQSLQPTINVKNTHYHKCSKSKIYKHSYKGFVITPHISIDVNIKENIASRKEIAEKKPKKHDNEFHHKNAPCAALKHAS